MYENILFYTLLLSQVLLISFYYPARMLALMKHFLAAYPPSTHPKLYPRPVEQYRIAHRRFEIMNRIILAAGLILIAVLIVTPRAGGWDHVIVTWLFFIQFTPLMLLDLRAFKEFKLMREANSSRTRKAELRPRRLLDFVSAQGLIVAILTYIGFVSLILYVKRFDFPWFGGYWNIFGVTVMNVFFMGAALWSLYGKKLNPHQANEDRISQIRSSVKIMFFVSVAATLHIAISIVFSALELRHLQPIAQCVYFQLVAVICLQSYFIGKMNFEVYKADSAIANAA